MASAAGMLIVAGSGKSVLMKCGAHEVGESCSTVKSCSTTADEEDGGLGGAGAALVAITST
jgi:hypothetical protein